MIRIPNVCLIGLAALTLSACANRQSEFPSLARRPAERLNTPALDPLPTPIATQTAPDPELIARIAGLEAKAQAAHERFTARTGQARTLVAAATGAKVASEPWSVATIALSELEAMRSEVMIALADIDALYARAEIERTDSTLPAKAREAIVAIVSEEDQVLGELQGRLPE